MLVNKIPQTLVGADLSALAGFSDISLHVLLFIIDSTIHQFKLPLRLSSRSFTCAILPTLVLVILTPHICHPER